MNYQQFRAAVPPGTNIPQFAALLRTDSPPAIARGVKRAVRARWATRLLRTHLDTKRAWNHIRFREMQWRDGVDTDGEYSAAIRASWSPIRRVFRQRLALNYTRKL